MDPADPETLALSRVRAKTMTKMCGDTMSHDERLQRGDAHTCEQFDDVCAERDYAERALAQAQEEIARLKWALATIYGTALSIRGHK
jgi:hypothetical protein